MDQEIKFKILLENLLDSLSSFDLAHCSTERQRELAWEDVCKNRQVAQEEIDKTYIIE